MIGELCSSGERGAAYARSLRGSSMSIGFGILGPLQVVDDGRPITPKGPKLRVLLATLLVHPGVVVPVHTLIEALWGSAPPASAAATLRSHLSRLRDVVESGNEAPRLIAEPFGYVLHVRPEEVDVYQFDSLAKTARQHRARGEWDAAEVTLRRSLSLWRGRALDGIGSEWLERVIVPGLEERRAAALEERIDIDLRLGRYEDLVAELVGMVPAYPFRERLHGQLMVALYCTGRQADALGVFRRLRHLVHDELGVEPTPGVQRLHRAILGGVTEAGLLTVLGGVAAPDDRGTAGSVQRRSHCSGTVSARRVRRHGLGARPAESRARGLRNGSALRPPSTFNAAATEATDRQAGS